MSLRISSVFLSAYLSLENVQSFQKLCQDKGKLFLLGFANFNNHKFNKTHHCSKCHEAFTYCLHTNFLCSTHVDSSLVLKTVSLVSVIKSNFEGAVPGYYDKIILNYVQKNSLSVEASYNCPNLNLIKASSGLTIDGDWDQPGVLCFVKKESLCLSLKKSSFGQSVPSYLGSSANKKILKRTNRNKRKPKNNILKQGITDKVDTINTSTCFSKKMFNMSVSAKLFNDSTLYCEGDNINTHGPYKIFDMGDYKVLVCTEDSVEEFYTMFISKYHNQFEISCDNLQNFPNWKESDEPA